MVFSMVVLDKMVEAVEESGSLPSSPLAANEQPSFVNAVHDFQLAMFDKCCESHGQSKQAAVKRCTSPATCERPMIYGVEGPEALCACYSVTDDVFDSFRGYVQQTNMCARLSEAKVSIDHDTNIARTTVRAQFIFRAKQVPVVGESDHPTYGCGAGLARGFQWTLYEFVMQTAKPFALTLTVITAIKLFIVIVMVSRCCGLCTAQGMCCEGNQFNNRRMKFEYQDEDGNVLGVREISCDLQHGDPHNSHGAPEHIRRPSCPPMIAVGPPVSPGEVDSHGSMVVADVVHEISSRQRVHQEHQVILSISNTLSPPPIPARSSR
jgi:hypothetical protein